MKIRSKHPLAMTPALLIATAFNFAPALSQAAGDPIYADGSLSTGAGLVSTGANTISTTTTIVLTPENTIDQNGDASTALNKAFNSGRMVEMTAGNYPVSNALTCKNTTIHAISGASYGTATPALATIVDNTQGSIAAGGALLTANIRCALDGIGITAATQSSYDAVSILGFGVLINRSFIVGGRYNLYMTGDGGGKILDSVFSYASSDGMNLNGCDNRIVGNTVHFAAGNGITVWGPDWTISNNFIEESGGNGLYLTNILESAVSNNQFQANLLSNLALNDARDVTVTGNVFMPCGNDGKEGNYTQSHISITSDGKTPDSLSFTGNIYMDGYAPGTKKLIPAYVYSLTGPAPTNSSIYEKTRKMADGIYANNAAWFESITH